MDPAKKGELYARLFRKAGAFLSKGNIARAVEVFKEGAELARSLGDDKMARRFDDEISRVNNPPSAGE